MKTSRANKLEHLLSAIKVKTVQKTKDKTKVSKAFAVNDGQTKDIDTLFISDALDLGGFGGNLK